MDFTFSGLVHVTVIVLFSVVTLWLSVSFAVRPADKKIRIIRTMSWATLFSILAGIAAGIGATALNVSLTEGAGEHKDLALLITSGLAEAMVPPVFGFAVLALSWMLASVGLRRQS